MMLYPNFTKWERFTHYL